MVVKTYNLVQHTYSEDFLSSVVSTNCLKNEDFHWNQDEHKNHPINKEISKYDIVYSIQNINNPKDEYGFLCLNVKTMDAGNFLYTIEWVLLDENLPTSVLKMFVKSIVKQLGEKRRETIEDAYRIDGIQTTKTFQASPVHNHSDEIANEVERLFLSSKQGYTHLTDEEIARFQEIAKRMNAPE